MCVIRGVLWALQVKVTVATRKEGDVYMEQRVLEFDNLSMTEKQNIVANALSSDYASIYFVDFDKDMVVTYRLNEPVREQLGDFFETRPKYEDALRKYIKFNVAPEDAGEFFKVASIENLRKVFSTNRMFVHDYRVSRNDKTYFFRMKAVSLSGAGELHSAIIGFADISSQKWHELERYAYVDSITGGTNYNRFKELMREEKQQGFLVALDVSSFKTINSTCGIKKGDEAIKGVWEAIIACLDENDVAAHIYADRFIIFSPTEDREQLCYKFDKITELLEHMSTEHELPQIVPYFGVAMWKPKDHIEQTYGYADIAKKSIKNSRELNYAFYTKEDADRLYQEKCMVDCFHDAILNKEFEIWYQPKYCPESGALLGAEALVRWRHNGEIIPPGKFIPIFEKNGMIRKLDEYVFRTVCEQQKAWEEEGQSLIPISINLSRISLYFQDIVDQYKAIIDDIGLSTKFVPLEITESAAIDNKDIKDLTDRFYVAGFALHMDDFGTGYSSLSTLNQLHFNTLKLDKSLIDYVGNYGGDKLLEHTIALAKDLGLHVTAEGVETQSQVDFLKGLHCDSIQGYFYSKPLPQDEFSKMVHEEKKYHGETGSVNIDLAGQEACSFKGILEEIVSDVTEYAEKQGKNFICNPIIFNEDVYLRKSNFKLIMKNVIEVITDYVPVSDSVILVCSRNTSSEANYVSYKFVIIGVNAGWSGINQGAYAGQAEKLLQAEREIKEMGGSMVIDMQEHKDMQFVIRLPFKHAMETVHPFMKLGKIINQRLEPYAEGKRVLIAEDNELNRFLTEEMLLAAGFSVDTVSDGKKAVEAVLGEAPGYYDFILMDLLMPVMDGFEAARKIRKLDDDKRNSIPIIALSSNARQEDVEDARRSGMNTHVAKPLEIDTLVKVMQDLGI